MSELTELFAFIFLVILAFWKKGGPGQLLYFLAGAVSIPYGLAWYDTYNTPAGFAMTSAIFALGVYCLVIAISKLMRGNYGEW